MNRPPLYYICHVNNLSSILTQGILSRAKIRELDIKHEDIHDDGVLQLRDKPIDDGRNLQGYVNLYFQPRNAMLYRLICNIGRDDIVILQISPSVFNRDGVRISDRNAAVMHANFYSEGDYHNHVNFSVFQKEYWTDSDDTKQRMMAEVLVPDCIDASDITSIFIANEKAKSKVTGITNKEFIFETRTFFLPSFGRKLSDRISLLKGDMFFSSMQTFTISVNTVGIMGKGLASRAKYQFPDAYVRYQDDCKSKKLKPGKPTLYKRSMRIEEELADDASQLKPERLNGHRWFLFFPTKRHWRDNSRIDDIEQSLQWLVANYAKEDITSIALPALGCGLGNLSWREVGPLMCSYLSKMNISSCIYLPMEAEIDDLYLSKEHLLR